MKENKDQPAFSAVTGLTKLEYASIEAMKGMLSNSALGYGDDFTMINQKAIACATELLKQLDNK